METETSLQDEDDIVTTEIDGELKEVIVIGTPLEQRLFDETVVNGGPATDISVEGGRIVIEPAEYAWWGDDEIQSLDESDDWRIVSIGVGDHGPTVTVEPIE
jgi:hypothetical protein